MLSRQYTHIMMTAVVDKVAKFPKLTGFQNKVLLSLQNAPC